MITTCLHLACKVTEVPRKVRDLVNIGYRYIYKCIVKYKYNAAILINFILLPFFFFLNRYYYPEDNILEISEVKNKQQ